MKTSCKKKISLEHHPLNESKPPLATQRAHWFDSMRHWNQNYTGSSCPSGTYLPGFISEPGSHPPTQGSDGGKEGSEDPKIKRQRKLRISTTKNLAWAGTQMSPRREVRGSLGTPLGRGGGPTYLKQKPETSAVGRVAVGIGRAKSQTTQGHGVAWGIQKADQTIGGCVLKTRRSVWKQQFFWPVNKAYFEITKKMKI